MTPRYVGAYSKQLDSASSLISMGARPYDPSTGRFDSMDPVDGGSLNNYDYAAQDPTNKYDLDGRMLAADFSGDTPFAIVTKQGNVTTTTNVQSTQTSSTSDAVWKHTTVTVQKKTGNRSASYDEVTYEGQPPRHVGKGPTPLQVWAGVIQCLAGGIEAGAAMAPEDVEVIPIVMGAGCAAGAAFPPGSTGPKGPP